MKEKIYLLPGFMCDHRLWDKVVPLLEEEYEIVHMPLPLKSRFDEIDKILQEEFEDEALNLLGFSLGGYISSYFTINHPERVKRLFLVSSSAGASNEIDNKRRKDKVDQVKQEGIAKLSYEKSASLLEKQNQENEELIKILQDMFNDLGYDHFVTHLESTFYRKNLIENMANLNIPVHLFYSTQDRLVNHAFIKELEKKDLAHVKISSREGTSHNIPLEDPITFANKIKEWMKTS